jgi:hypothetical protein
MRRRFGRRDGGYRRERPRTPIARAHLWPFARALVATLDLAGVPPDLTPFDADAEIALHLHGLERYWDARSVPPAYASDPPRTVIGGDLYYDDNAWVGLALAQLERMRPELAPPGRLAGLVDFARSGWDTEGTGPHPGGIFWVQQGRGAGRRNHDRNTVSTAPNAQLGLHLAELRRRSPPRPDPISPQAMYEWVGGGLDAGGDGGGLFWDKIRGDGTIDRAQWSYNQGSMIGLNVLLARHAGRGARMYLDRAERIAARALAHYGGGGLERQPAAFNAIFFRNLLLLHDATGDEALQTAIIATIRGYADHAWEHRRDRRDLVRLSGRAVTLLDQSAIVQILALLAWDPAGYGLLA